MSGPGSNAGCGSKSGPSRVSGHGPPGSSNHTNPPTVHSGPVGGRQEERNGLHGDVCLGTRPLLTESSITILGSANRNFLEYGEVCHRRLPGSSDGVNRLQKYTGARPSSTHAHSPLPPTSCPHEAGRSGRGKSAPTSRPVDRPFPARECVQGPVRAVYVCTCVRPCTCGAADGWESPQTLLGTAVLSLRHSSARGASSGGTRGVPSVPLSSSLFLGSFVALRFIGGL